MPEVTCDQVLEGFDHTYVYYSCYGAENEDMQTRRIVTCDRT